MGIRVKTRKYRDSNGELQVKYHDLPRDGVGFGTARVFRMTDDAACHRLWEVFGTVGITSRPMLREMMAIRRDVMLIRKIQRGQADKDDCIGSALKGIYEMISHKIFTPLVDPFTNYAENALTGG